MRFRTFQSFFWLLYKKIVYNLIKKYIYKNIFWCVGESKYGGGPFGRRRLDAAHWAPDNWAPCRAVWEPDIWALFPNFFYIIRVMKKK